MREPEGAASHDRIPARELARTAATRVYLVRTAPGRYEFATEPTDGLALAAFAASGSPALGIFEPPPVDGVALYRVGAGAITL